MHFNLENNIVAKSRAFSDQFQITLTMPNPTTTRTRGGTPDSPFSVQREMIARFQILNWSWKSHFWSEGVR
jgi:hypothetical protein